MGTSRGDEENRTKPRQQTPRLKTAPCRMRCLNTDRVPDMYKVGIPRQDKNLLHIRHL